MMPVFTFGAPGAATVPDDDEDLVVAIEEATVVRGGAELLKRVSWWVAANERWVLLGPNGAGKTTLLNLAGARLFPTRGQVRVLGETLGRVDVNELRTRIGLSTVALHDRIPPEEVVLDVVRTAAWGVVGAFREEYHRLDSDRARLLLDQMGVGALAGRTYGTLSEGERKRVQIARALMTDPELLLLDEPAAGLDLGGREDLVRRLGALAADRRAPALALVTHHVEEIPPGFVHALLLRAGTVVAQGPIRAVLTSENLSATFDAPLRVSFAEGRFSARAA
jgi:iron complex transport system ATP-binding protein